MATILTMPKRSARILQMPSPLASTRLRSRYGMGDLTLADVTGSSATPWYSNPLVVMGALLAAGIYLGGVGHREGQGLARRHRRRVRRVKSAFHSVDWSSVSAVVIASGLTGAVTYLMTRSTTPGA